MEISTPKEDNASIDEEDSTMRSENQDTSNLRDATQNDPQVFDMVKSPELPSKNMEEESMSCGELQSIPEIFSKTFTCNLIVF